MSSLTERKSAQLKGNSRERVGRCAQDQGLNWNKMASDEEFLLKWHDHHQVNMNLEWKTFKEAAKACHIKWKLPPVVLHPCGGAGPVGTTDRCHPCLWGWHQSSGRQRCWGWFRRWKLTNCGFRWIFSSSAPVRTLPYALGLLSVLPTAVERELAQGEAPYHPPPRGQPETYAAVVALHVQVKNISMVGSDVSIS